MTKYLQQDITEESGNKLFHSALDTNFFLVNDWGPKDKYPDIDGQIRLRDGRGSYLNKYLHYQVKATGKLKGEKFFCKRGILDYLAETNVPTLLFVVDTVTSKVYWYCMTKEMRAELSKDTKGRTLDLHDTLISGNSAELQSLWESIAKEDNYIKISDSLKKIITDFSSKVIGCVGLLHLLQKLKKEKAVEVFGSLLQIDDAEGALILKKLIKEGVVTETENLYLVENEQVGVESSFELLNRADAQAIYEAFPDSSDQQTLLTRLSVIKHPGATSLFKSILKKTDASIKRRASNDEIFDLLERVEAFSHLFPKEVLRITRAIVSMTPIKPKVIHVYSDSKLFGKDHKSLLVQISEILKHNRYISTESILPILINLTKDSDAKVNSTAKEVIKQLSQYNIHILRKIEYSTQKFILNELKKWSGAKLVTYSDVVQLILTELLTPSFEGTTWEGMTITMHRGPLVLNKSLEEIRDDSIEILRKLFKASKAVTERKAVLNTLEQVARTPDHAGMTEDLKNRIHKDTNTLIDFYIDLIKGDVEYEIIKEIEERVYWFSQWHGKDNFPRLDELNSLIANDTEYALFKTFVGYDVRLARGLEWSEIKEQRTNQVATFIDQINDKTFVEWKKKIVVVTKNYTRENHGEYLYFTQYLYELGKNKPALAFRLLHEIEKELQDFSTHLIAGIYSSSVPEMATDLMNQWIIDNKNLPTIVEVLNYTQEPHIVDSGILKKLFAQSKRTKNVVALTGIVRLSHSNYEKVTSLKGHFLKGIKELKELNSTYWLNGIWYRRNSLLLESLTSSEADLVLDAMVGLSRIEYHAEEVMLPIAQKWPAKIADFFLKRVKSKENRTRQIGDYYDAIPHRFQQLVEPLKENQEIVLPMVLSWYGKGSSKHKWLYQWEASQFIESIFGVEFTAYFEKALKKLVRSADKKNLKAVLSILQNYHGGEKVWDVCREIVRTYSNDNQYKSIKNSMFTALTNTGGVSGEDGFVKEYEARLRDAESFNAKGPKAIEHFKQELIEILKLKIEYERKRAEEAIKLRGKGLY